MSSVKANTDNVKPSEKGFVIKKAHKKQVDENTYNRELKQHKDFDKLYKENKLDEPFYNSLRTSSYNSQYQYDTCESKYISETHILNSDTSSNKYLVSKLRNDLYLECVDFEKTINKELSKNKVVVKVDEDTFKEIKLYITYIQGDEVKDFKGKTAREQVETMNLKEISN
tara:strand:- start:252 stop:761 length:510 start_codon:yes stop_codon:yes gene_type:complete